MLLPRQLSVNDKDRAKWYHLYIYNQPCDLGLISNNDTQTSAICTFFEGKTGKKKTFLREKNDTLSQSVAFNSWVITMGVIIFSKNTGTTMYKGTKTTMLAQQEVKVKISNISCWTAFSG